MGAQIVFKPGLSLNKLPPTKVYLDRDTIRAGILLFRDEWHHALGPKMVNASRVNLDMLFRDILELFEEIEPGTLDS